MNGADISGLCKSMDVASLSSGMLEKLHFAVQCFMEEYGDIALCVQGESHLSIFSFEPTAII